VRGPVFACQLAHALSSPQVSSAVHVVLQGGEDVIGLLRFARAPLAVARKSEDRAARGGIQAEVKLKPACQFPPCFIEDAVLFWNS